MIIKQEKKNIILFPNNKEEEVLQNINTILSIVKEEQPLCREFGLDSSFIDKPSPITKSIMIGDIIDAIEEREKRVSVNEVSFDDATSEKIVPIVEVIIND